MRNSPRFLSNSGFSLEDLILGACAQDPLPIPAVPTVLAVLRFSVAHAPAPDPLFSHIRSADSIPADFLDMSEEIPAGRFGSAEEIADAVLFLVKNEYCNGTILSVNGGM